MRRSARREPLRAAVAAWQIVLYIVRVLYVHCRAHYHDCRTKLARQRGRTCISARRIDLLELRQREHDASSVRRAELALKRVALEIDRVERGQSRQLRLDVRKLAQLIVARLAQSARPSDSRGPRTRSAD